jgi:hypothetical protein
MNKSLIKCGLATVAATLLLAGCGLADVGASAAVEGASAADQAKQGKEMEAKIEKKMDDANKAAADQRAAAEQASQ